MVSLVGSVGIATATAGSVTASFGQTPTAGNLLVTVIAAASAGTQTANISTTATGWTRLPSGTVGNNASGTSRVAVDAWYAVAAGGDTAPAFTQTLGTSPVMVAYTYELSGANTSTPLDVSAVQQTGSASTTVTFSLTTGSAAAAGEYAISILAQYHGTAGSLTWTESGTGWTTGTKEPAGSSILSAQSNYRSGVASGAALTDAGSFSTGTSSYGAALIIVVAGAAAAPALADTGAGSDTATPAVAASLADSGSAADPLASPAAAVPATDAGACSEALTLASAVSLAADAGSGADGAAAAAAVPLADSGVTAGETLVAGQATPLAETGAASDQAAVTVAASLAETGTAGDGLAAPVTVEDSGTGDDSGFTGRLAFTDSGSAAETLTPGHVIADTGTGSDAAVTVTVAAPLADSATGDDLPWQYNSRSTPTFRYYADLPEAALQRVHAGDEFLWYAPA